jgi:hypothetical protein
MRHSIELALRRITDRSFGVCVHCGEEVKRRRLEAVPWAPSGDDQSPVFPFMSHNFMQSIREMSIDGHHPGGVMRSPLHGASAAQSQG